MLVWVVDVTGDEPGVVAVPGDEHGVVVVPGDQHDPRPRHLNQPNSSQANNQLHPQYSKVQYRTVLYLHLTSDFSFYK